MCSLRALCWVASTQRCSLRLRALPNKFRLNQLNMSFSLLCKCIINKTSFESYHAWFFSAAFSLPLSCAFGKGWSLWYICLRQQDVSLFIAQMYFLWECVCGRERTLDTCDVLVTLGADVNRVHLLREMEWDRITLPKHIYCGGWEGLNRASYDTWSDSPLWSKCLLVGVC